MSASQLRRLRLDTSWGELTLVGGSRAGEGTLILLPQLHLALDAGRPHRALPAMTTLLVSHGHADHLGGVAYWASQRQLQSMGPARLLAPSAIAPAIEDLLMIHSRLEGGALYDVEVTSESYPYTRTVRLAFTRRYHPDALAAIYQGTPGIEAAYPAIQSDGAYDIFADVPAPGVYTGVYGFEESWIECGPGGCFFRHHTWIYQVTTDGVTLIDESGPPLAVEPGSWGAIKSRYRDQR